MQITGVMIGTAGHYTISAVVERHGDGRYRILARAFDHPDPKKTLPSGTSPRHIVDTMGDSAEQVTHALEAALIRLVGPLDWTRWRFFDAQ